MEYLYPASWTLLAVALVVYGANLFRRKCPEADYGETISLLLDTASYLDADASEGGAVQRAKLTNHAQRLEAIQRGEK